METIPNLEITAVTDYYDGPVAGEARLGDRQLYYIWVEQNERRVFCAWELSEDEWDIIHRNPGIKRDAVSGDRSPEALQAEILFSRICELHRTLLRRDGVVGFLDDWVAFPESV